MKTFRAKTSLTFVVAVVAASQLGATDCGTILRDPGFDLWCGDSLCSWKLTRGDIDRVGTWNPGDSGVSFVGADTAIQQTAPVNSFDGHCISFYMIANVSPAADVVLNIDLEGDGTVEKSESIPASNWQPLQFLIAIEGPYDGIRFELAKTGTGTAVLANIGAEIADGACNGVQTIKVAPRMNGARCDTGSDCASNICIDSPTPVPGGGLFDFVCGGCDPAESSCGVGMACGIGDPTNPTLAEPVECIASASRELGESCATDGECVSGTCNAHTCSVCRTVTDCGGQACATSWPGGPAVCRPGAHAGITGTSCGTDADCTGTCNGTVRKECSDGRPCDSPGDCPVDTGLAPGACTTVGIQGGSCS